MDVSGESRSVQKTVPAVEKTLSDHLRDSADFHVNALQHSV
jgi:hypothetical protein